MKLYEPLDFVVVRAPLLPVDALGATAKLGDLLTGQTRAALAVGSLAFSDALAKDGDIPLRPRTRAALRRYLIRMSTRPTPMGLFAGVGMAKWGERTDLELVADHRPRRTRPDAAWLMDLVDRAEADPLIRRHLKVRSNPLVLERAGRFLLAERNARDNAALSVSVRATEVVRFALDTARTPIRFGELAARVLGATPGARIEQVVRLLAQLCEQTLLQPDLPPPLTLASPARYVLEKLQPIAAATNIRSALESLLQETERWDAQPLPDEIGYRALVAEANRTVSTKGAALQVDSALAFASGTVAKSIAEDAARAAELLLRLSRSTQGPASLEAYRRAFEQHYGEYREVPLVEMVDPHVGIGPLPSGSADQTSPGSAARNQALLDLAVHALLTGSREVSLDGATLAKLGSTDMPVASVPLSLDLLVVVAAASREAIDAGDYDLIVGPAIGSSAAGRMLGRFADFVPGAPQVLAQIAAAEAERSPGKIIAELVYQPRSRRLGNVSTRPNMRGYEIAIDLPPGTDPGHSIDVNELAVSIRDGRFRVRWTRTGQEVVIVAGHMLTSTRAPAAARFLSEVGRHRTRQLGGFSWGPAASFPYLPRVRHGRIVLALAQWRLRADNFPSGLGDAAAFREQLEAWRARWNAPATLVIATGDNRLTLDLSRDDDAEELRRNLRRHGSLVLQEQFPPPERTWLTDTKGRRFASELVVPLIRRTPTPTPPVASIGVHGVDIRPPGSDWIYVKLYCPTDTEGEFITGTLRAFTSNMAGDGFAEWFFIRYSDPRPHIRLRFRGQPQRLIAVLLPRLTAWATGLTRSGVCQRFSIDTYDREVDRFGGPEGLAAAEDLFFADSAAVVDLLASNLLPPLPTAVMTVDALLAGFGLNGPARAHWCAARSGTRALTGADYRQWKALLRPMLLGETAKQPLDAFLLRFRQASADMHEAVTALHESGRLSRTPDDLRGSVVHLHLNRLLGRDRAMERRVFGLLERLLRGLRTSDR